MSWLQPQAAVAPKKPASAKASAGEAKAEKSGNGASKAEPKAKKVKA